MKFEEIAQLLGLQSPPGSEIVAIKLSCLLKRDHVGKECSSSNHQCSRDMLVFMGVTCFFLGMAGLKIIDLHLHCD